MRRCHQSKGKHMTYPFAGTIQTKLTQDNPVIAWKEVNMTNIRPIDTNAYRDNAKEVLEEAISETPDSVIVLCFWKASQQFRIKTSASQDRLSLIGAIEEAKNKLITDGFIK